MAIFLNSMTHGHTVHMVGYRADGLKFEQNAPDIPKGKARYVNGDHYGDNDWYIVVAYMKDASIPDRIGVTQSTEGGGGAIGITVGGNGLTLNGAGTRTVFYSDGLAAVKAEPHDAWMLIEHPDEKKWAFVPCDQPVARDALMGW